MKLNLLFLSAAILGLDMPAHAQAPDTWTEDVEWAQIGKTWLLNSETAKRIYDDRAIQVELERIGIAAGCPLAKASLSHTVSEFAEDFRILAIRGLRVTHSPTQSYEEQYLLMPNGGENGILRRRLIRMDGAFFDAVEQKARSDLHKELKNIPDATGDWRGRFSDWDFPAGSGLVYQNACLVETMGEPEQAKRTFDGFYKTRD